MNSGPTPEQIRGQQRELWDKFSPGWKKWDEAELMRPIGDAIVVALELPANAAALDIATGTGEPGLTIAALRPNGTVVGTDLSERMLAIAQSYADERGLRNYRTSVADVCALPFPDASFDAVSCRMGFMYFPDLALAAREIVRVLKPGGRCATSVWSGPEKNPWITIINGAISRHAALPAPPPGAPGIFRCAAPGMIAGLFRDAGLRDVAERDVDGRRSYQNAEHYWSMMTEIAAPVVSAMSKLDEPTKAKIKADVVAALPKAGDAVPLAFGARVISGRKT